MVALAEQKGVRLLLPLDVRVSDSLDASLNQTVTDLTRSCCSPEKPCIPGGEGRKEGLFFTDGAQQQDSGRQILRMRIYSQARKNCSFATTCHCTRSSPPAGKYGIDIGPQSESAFAEALSGCKTIFLNGPMGKFEVGYATDSLGLKGCIRVEFLVLWRVWTWKKGWKFGILNLGWPPLS